MPIRLDTSGERSGDEPNRVAPAPRRGVIAVLTDEYAPYQQHLVESIAEALDEGGFGTLCVNGGELVPPEIEHQRFTVCNAIYALIARSNVQGVICLSGTLARRVGLQTLAPFLDRFKVPLVSIGVDVPGVRSIVMHESNAMKALMQHLIDDEQRQHFAFLRGFANDSYSHKREVIFTAALQRCGRTLTEPCYVEGEWDGFTAYRAVSDLLERHPGIDTIVAANDTMALGAARAVSATGRRIPGDVAITGFDDTPEATSHSPPLTTVRQPIEHMATAAAHLLIDSLNGRTPACDVPLFEVDAELVVRGSTFSPHIDSATLAAADAETLHTLLSNALTGLLPPERVDLATIAQALSRTLDSNGDELRYCLAEQPIPSGDDYELHWWSNLCAAIESLTGQVMEQRGGPGRANTITAALWPRRERIFAIGMEHEFAKRRAHEIRADMQLDISSCTTTEQIVATLGRWTSNLKPQRAFVVRYDGPTGEPPAQASLLQWYSDDTSRRGPVENFATQALLPASLSDQLVCGTLVLSPLYAGDALFGYLMIDPSGISLSRIDSAAHSIGNAMRSKHLINTLETQALTLNAANANLEQLANFDMLTGLPNRRRFQQHLDMACNGTPRTPMALCFLDLDGFKQVNDTLGHKAGDLLLAEVARRVLDVLSDDQQADAFVARLGGDEFTIMFGGIDNVARLGPVAETILAAVARPFDLNGQTARLSASIGAALFPAQADSATDLLRRADEAMYAAKTAGKNRFAVYQVSPGGPGTRRVAGIHALARAHR